MAAEPAASCCSAKTEEAAHKDLEKVQWIQELISTAVGPVWQVRTALNSSDHWGAFKARWGVNRMEYTVPPGLYAVGNPDHNSSVLISANYKLSFDYLRRELGGLNLWILVLDTKGINVWCAAGKGSFGTEELLRMICASNLKQLVSHRRLILPQLAAPGVTAHRVQSESGFKVIYGPVRASDLPAFFCNNMQADQAMRHPTFNLADRLVLTPVELTALIKPLAATFMLFFLLNLADVLLNARSLIIGNLLSSALQNLLPVVITCLIGAVLVPAMLPYIPGRALAWKGWLAGIIWTSVYLWLVKPEPSWFYITAMYLTLPAISAFLGMSFTGSTTYTSLSGVAKEIYYALPLIIISVTLGLLVLTASYFF